MFMRNMILIYLSLGVGYALCVVAKKQDGMLKTVGYTIGITVISLTLLFGALLSYPYLDVMCSKGVKACCTLMSGHL